MLSGLHTTSGKQSGTVSLPAPGDEVHPEADRPHRRRHGRRRGPEGLPAHAHPGRAVEGERPVGLDGDGAAEDEGQPRPPPRLCAHPRGGHHVARLDLRALVQVAAAEIIPGTSGINQWTFAASKDQAAPSCVILQLVC